MKRSILSCWIDLALELEAERDEAVAERDDLRALIVDLIVWVGTQRDLAEFARAQIEARWPAARKAA